MTTRALRTLAALSAAAAMATASPAPAQTTSKLQQAGPSTAASDIPSHFDVVRDGYDYVRREAMIPMRDGVKLYTIIMIPKGATHAPMMLDRTPYSAKKLTTRGEGGPFLSQNLFPAYAELAEHGYIIVAQDVRGKYGSGGDYVMNRPVRGPLNQTRVDHPTDTWDTIDWLVKNVHESNGRVGTIGTSYDGFTALMSLVNPHPALKASVPMNPMVDTWKGDDWFHNGAFRQEMMSYVYGQTAKKDSGEEWFSLRYDDYDTFMHYGSAGAFGAAMGMGQLPFWNRLVSHAAYDGFWQGQAVDQILARSPLTVPTLLVDSQWDQEDIYGAPAVWRALDGKPGSDRLHMVLGPWYHGEENGDGSRLGALDWGSDTGKWFRQNVLIPFLDANLKDDAPPADIAKVTAYVTGTDQWVRLPAWPAAKPTTPLYLGANGSLSLDQAPAAGDAAFDQYVSDPAKPVTYRERPNQAPYVKGSTWRSWLVDDQRFAAGRPDVLVYETAPLDKPLHLAGRPVADLFAATSGTDSDWVVKLIDVYPDVMPDMPAMGGYQLPISMDILRGRYRDDPAHPTAIPADKVVAYTLPLTDIDHVFLPGHRIMVQVQSSWFPLYDRNPQSFVPNIFEARPADYRAATQRVYHTPDQASRIELPVVK